MRGAARTADAHRHVPHEGLQWLFREKLRPARPVSQQFREKTRPARLKTAFFTHFGLAGRTFSRSQPLKAEQGELFRARSHSRPSRANYFAFRRHVRDAGRRISRTGLDPGRRNMATLKPPTPLLTPNKGPLKPASPLHGETAPKTPISRPQRQRRFQTLGPPRLLHPDTVPMAGADTTAPKFRT